MAKKVSRVLVMRHGERLDLTFDNWLEKCFDKGSYNQLDLNMPETLPKRLNGTQGWIRDSPLTNVGTLQAQLIGKALLRKGIRIDRAYSSPAFRSITTCAAALEGLSSSVPINVEASLFEWCFWHKHLGLSAVDWLTVEELQAAGINVSGEYKTKIANKDMPAHLEETVEEFQDRTGRFVEELASGMDGETILIVAHGPTGQVSQQRLLKKPKLTADQLIALMLKIPFCSLLELQRVGEKDQPWKIVQGSYSVTHMANNTWDVNVLMDNV